jgi:hypothetical protein
MVMRFRFSTELVQLTILNKSITGFLKLSFTKKAQSIHFGHEQNPFRERQTHL